MTEEEALASGAAAVAVKLESLFKRWYDESDDDLVWLEASEKEWSFAEFIAAGLVTEIPEVFALHERARIREELEAWLIGRIDPRDAGLYNSRRIVDEIERICSKEPSDG